MKITGVIFFLIPISIHAQIIEKFEENNLEAWYQYPAERWETSSLYPLKDNYSLHHYYDNTLSASDRISLLHDPLYLDSLATVWKFTLRYDYFPSAENNWAFFLLSDKPAGFMHPDSLVHAYATGVNLAGYDDLLKIWKISEKGPEVLVNTGFNTQTGISTEHGVSFEIHRTTAGHWSIYIDTTGSESHYAFLDEGSDNEFVISNFVGLYYKYSSSQDRNIWMDNLEISGFFKKDTIPPVVKGIRTISPEKLIIDFNESINEQVITPHSITVNNGIGNPSQIIMMNPASVMLVFQNVFHSAATYEIKLNQLEDLYENSALDLRKEFSYYEPLPFDIVINEIMADPEPERLLPDAEYLEILNTSGFKISLAGWKLAFNEQVISLPESNINANDYLIVTDEEDTTKFMGHGKILAVKSMPALLNDGMSLTLADPSGQVVHTVTYSGKWYDDALKSEGGWSLEMIDPENPCAGYENWDVSDHPQGGTPGKVNSVAGLNPDNVRPALLRAATTSDSSLLVSFTESMRCQEISVPDFYSVTPDIYHPFGINPVWPDYASVHLTFPVKFDKYTIYELMVKDEITDCAGNIINDSFISFGMASVPDSFDLIINEILFDASGNNKFAEIKNRSDKIVELAGVKLALMDRMNESIHEILYEFPACYQLFPESYALVTENQAMLRQHYACLNPASINEGSGMASLPEKSGTLALLDNNLKILDQFGYSSDLHFQLLTITEGVSLERIHDDKPTNLADNWHSAAADAGFATPGYENSQAFKGNEISPAEIWVEPEVFTPDNDGTNDYVTLNYLFDKPGYVATILVFDSRGRIIKQLANNLLLGTRGMLTWDGINADGRLEDAGIYVFYTEVFVTSGEVFRYKKTFVLAKKMI
jgi:hypothetical protein